MYKAGLSEVRINGMIGGHTHASVSDAALGDAAQLLRRREQQYDYHGVENRDEVGLDGEDVVMVEGAEPEPRQETVSVFVLAEEPIHEGLEDPSNTGTSKERRTN
jgi:hypothetical protein